MIVHYRGPKKYRLAARGTPHLMKIVEQVETLRDVGRSDAIRLLLAFGWDKTLDERYDDAEEIPDDIPGYAIEKWDTDNGLAILQ